MKKNSTKIRVFVLGLAMAMTTTTLFAQKSDGFFSSYNNEDNRGNEGLTIENTETEDPNPSPVGGGLLILVAAGAGYALLKNNNKNS